MKRALFCCLFLTACGARTGVRVGDDAATPPDAGHRDAGADLGAGTPCDEPPVCGGRLCNSFVDDQEVFELPSPYTNDVPTITLDERGELAIFVPATGGGGYVGYLVRRVGRTWSSARVVPPAASGALATGAPGPLVLHAYDGAFGNTLWMERGGMLVSLGAVPTDSIVSAGGVVRDRAGSLHFLGEAGTGRDSRYAPTYLRRDASGAFDTTLLPDMPMGIRGGAITVDGDSTPWIVWRTTRGVPGEQIIEAWSATGGEETVMNALVTDGASAALRVAAAGAAIWIAYIHNGLLVLAQREGVGEWRPRVIGGPEPAYCGAAAPCQAYVPLGVVASCDGTASVFYARPGRAPGDDVVQLGAADGTRGGGEIPVMVARAAVIGGTVVRDAVGDVHVAYLVQDEVRRLSVRYGRWTNRP